MKTLYLDCFSGISGNMFIGMLIQAGVPFEAFKQAMASLNLTGYDLVCRSVNKLGIQSIYYNVLLESEGHGHEHHHHHDHDGHEHAHHEHPEHHDEGQGHLVDTTGIITTISTGACRTLRRLSKARLLMKISRPRAWPSSRPWRKPKPRYMACRSTRFISMKSVPSTASWIL